MQGWNTGETGRRGHAAGRRHEDQHVGNREKEKRRGNCNAPRQRLVQGDQNPLDIRTRQVCRCARNQLFETPQRVDVKLCRLATENVHISDMTLTT